MEIFGELERFASEVLYPYRVPISAAGAVALAAGLAWSWRAGWIRRGLDFTRRRPAASALAMVALLAVLVPLGNYLVAPLWTRSEVVEASPLDVEAFAREREGQPQPAREVAAPPSDPKPGASAPSAAFQPRAVSRGDWKGADEFHFARGRAIVIETAPGQYVLRVEDFSVRNGPDLFVMLSPAPDGYRDGALKLGRLRATDGAFNYEIPPGTDLARFQSVVIWCEQFATLFGTATLAKNP